MQPTYNTDVVNTAIAKAVARPGWTQARLATALGVRPQTVNKWVKGENTPPYDRWPAIEHALDIPLGTFMTLVMGSDAIQHDMLPEGAGAHGGIDLTGLEPEDVDALRAMVEAMKAARGIE